MLNNKRRKKEEKDKQMRMIISISKENRNFLESESKRRKVSMSFLIHYCIRRVIDLEDKEKVRENHEIIKMLQGIAPELKIGLGYKKYDIDTVKLMCDYIAQYMRGRDRRKGDRRKNQNKELLLNLKKILLPNQQNKGD